MVYLIHLDEPLAHAQHYLGFTIHDDPTIRLEEHKKSQGSRMLAACNRAGIDYGIVRTWPEGDRNFERSLKNRKKTARLCPVCQAQKKNCSPKKP